MTRTALPALLAIAIAGTEATAHAAPPAPNAASTPDDPELAAARTRIVKKGKTLQWTGLSISFGGALLAIVSSVASPVGSTTGIAGASVGVVAAATGLGLTIAGYRRIRHPEKFMRRAQLAASPWGTRTGGGAAFVLRF